VHSMFVCRQHEGHLCDLIEGRGFRVTRLSPPACGSADISGHAVWLGVAWQRDAEETRAAIEAASFQPTWLVVDHYAIDSRWETALRPSVDRIMMIDDMADRKHDCDLLLDQNLVVGMESRYESLLPKSCMTLIGPKYAMLQPVFAETRVHARVRSGKIQRILVFFGGADSVNMTRLTLSALIGLNRPDIHIDVVIGPANIHAAGICKQVEALPNICLHANLQTLAPLIASADLCVGACGVNTWERLCLGLPTIVITLAENQRQIAEELHRLGLVRWLGDHSEIGESTIARAFDELIRRGLDDSWSESCFAVVDGAGIQRVMVSMAAVANTPFTVRHVHSLDESLLIEWANDPETRRNSFNPAPIRPETHKQWFKAHMESPNKPHFYIVQAMGSIPLGQVRFEDHGPEWEIHFALAPMFRGLGLGRRFLTAALRTFRTEVPQDVIFGQVKDENFASKRIFESLGFEIRPSEGRGGAVFTSIANTWV
jgi:UDP-2,4-diacetamido-2,4,6-trideoxy-beta-L-altropyranose hydrolase